jgi:hypothetical protein
MKLPGVRTPSAQVKTAADGVYPGKHSVEHDMPDSRRASPVHPVSLALLTFIGMAHGSELHVKVGGVRTPRWQRRNGSEGE